VHRRRAERTMQMQPAEEHRESGWTDTAASAATNENDERGGKAEAGVPRQAKRERR
jgi:hypothetical protein